MSYNTVKIKKYVDIVEEYVASEAISPGMLVEITSAGLVKKHATEGGNALTMIALEDELQGEGLTDSYSAGDVVQCWIPRRGDQGYVQLEDDTPPLIPMDTGNLRASWFTATSTGEGEAGDYASFRGNNASEMQSNHGAVTSACSQMAAKYKYPVLVMGFSANYATYVHEMVDAGREEGINWKRPGSGPKFFESALKRNKKNILEIIRENTQIPK